jgi:hypothetical protein
MHSAVFPRVWQPVIPFSLFSIYARRAAGVESVVAPKRGPTIGGPYRNLCNWLHPVDTTGASAFGVFRVAPALAFVRRYLAMSVTSPCGLDIANRRSGLGVRRAGGIGRPRRTDGKDKLCKRVTEGRP